MNTYHSQIGLSRSNNALAKVSVHSVQLQSVKINGLYQRRKTKQLSDQIMYEASDRVPSIPDEYSPAEKIQTPPSFLRLPTSYRRSVC